MYTCSDVMSFVKIRHLDLQVLFQLLVSFCGNLKPHAMLISPNDANAPCCCCTYHNKQNKRLVGQLLFFVRGGLFTQLVTV